MSDNAENKKPDGDEENKVYEYLKEHPSVLIACVSAIVAAGTFILNAVIYYIDSRYFLFWGYDINQCDYKNPNQIYIIAITFVFVVTINLVQQHCNKIFSVYCDRTAWIHIEKRMLKVLGKLSREQKKKVKVATSEKKTGNESETEESETSTSEDYSRQIQELLSKIKASKRRLRHENREMIKQLIVPLVPPAVIIFLVSIVFLSAVGTVKLTPWIRVIHSLAYSVSLVALGFFLLYGFARFTLQLRIRKCDDDYEQLMQLYDETEEYSDNKYPRNNWKSLRLNDVLKDEQIKTTLITLLGFLVFYFIIHSFVANSSQSNRKEFPICYVDEAPYIVVYQSSNTYYLDQAVISDCQITIDTRAHRVINSDDVSFTSTKFEAVTILRD